MSDPQQEMTLEQWLDRLPSFHLANREYQELLARVEELERIACVPDDPVGGGEYVITDDQIDAAWEKTESLRDSLLVLERPDIEKITCNIREELMREFNIFRCEKCDQGRIFSTPQVGLPLVCPDCNGHSYVIVPDDGPPKPGADVGVINDV